jgi:hypothetical protein
MNKAFAEHVTQTAFFLSISKRQIEHLEHLLKHPWEPEAHSEKAAYFAKRPGLCDSNIHKPDSWIRTFEALAGKGLVEWAVHERRLNKHASSGVTELGHWELTEPGRLVCSLLVEAGLIERAAPVEVAA